MQQRLLFTYIKTWGCLPYKNKIEVVFHLQKKVMSSSSFNNAIDGTSLGEPVHGKISGSKNGDVNVVQIELEKGNKKFIQIDTKIKSKIYIIYLNEVSEL